MRHQGYHGAPEGVGCFAGDAVEEVALVVVLEVRRRDGLRDVLPHVGDEVAVRHRHIELRAFPVCGEQEEVTIPIRVGGQIVAEVEPALEPITAGGGGPRDHERRPVPGSVRLRRALADRPSGRS